MTVFMMRVRWHFVAGAELYDAIFEFMQIFCRVSRVDDEFCRTYDFSKVIGAMVRKMITQSCLAISSGDASIDFKMLRPFVNSARTDRCRREARLCP